MATPGEANPRTDADLDRTVAPPHVYAQPWMDPTTETGRQRRLAPLDAEATGDLLNSLLGTDPNHTAFARALNEAGYVVVPREAAGA